jgi:hypothetical protein
MPSSLGFRVRVNKVHPREAFDHGTLTSTGSVSQCLTESTETQEKDFYQS